MICIARIMGGNPGYSNAMLLMSYNKEMDME